MTSNSLFRVPCALVVLVYLAVTAVAGEAALPAFSRQRLSDVYYSEGANAGDLNGDHVADVVCGPYWYAGPDYKTKFEIYAPVPQDTNGYADNFFNWPYDFNGDGWNDVFVVGFPGTPAYVYENPGTAGFDNHWKKHQVLDWVSNESPQWTNIVADERPELVCTRDGFFGFATVDWEKPFAPWTFHPISEQIASTQFGHGLGVGDVNGDGRMDVIHAGGWFEQPLENALTGRWPYHETAFSQGYGGAEMYAYDVDGDGDNDIITGHAAHDFGLGWYEQINQQGDIDQQGDSAEPTFQHHLIMGAEPSENKYGVVFSELHSLALADIDGDGLKDIVTGKTYWSHHKQSPQWDAGAVVYWFRLVRTKEGVDWVPYKADGEAGIGRQVSIVDVNNDQRPDIVVGGMLGCHVLTHQAPALTKAEPAEVFNIWPDGKMPGTSATNPAEKERVVTDRRRPFYQLTNVSTPTVSVFLAPDAIRTGASVLVCPGGGMQRLAFEHEGLEIANWLNPLGIHVFVLKYRVPGPAATALLDAQRAMGLIRKRAAEFKLDPNRLGTMGFSAGGEVAVLLATNFERRAYEPLDDADEIDCRPTNACLVYPGGIVGRDGVLREAIKEKLNAKSTPPMFVVHAFNDASQNSLALGVALKQARVPAEIHIYQEGGHGFGARESGLPLNGWKASYVLWLKSQGFLDKPYVAPYAEQYLTAVKSPGSLQRFSTGRAAACVDDAYAVQRRLVADRLSHDRIAGFKAGAATAESQKALGLSRPMTGVLFESGRAVAKGEVSVQLDNETNMLETEIGFIVSEGVDISTHISTIDHIKGAVESIVPVIELPANLRPRMDGDLTGIDSIAVNIAADRFIVGSQPVSADDINPDDVMIVLQKDGQNLHETSANVLNHGQWEHLRTVVNQIVDQGYTLHGGDLIIGGALGKIHPASHGKYRADFGKLGCIDFELN